MAATSPSQRSARVRRAQDDPVEFLQGGQRVIGGTHQGVRHRELLTEARRRATLSAAARFLSGHNRRGVGVSDVRDRPQIGTCRCRHHGSPAEPVVYQLWALHQAQDEDVRAAHFPEAAKNDMRLNRGCSATRRQFLPQNCGLYFTSQQGWKMRTLCGTTSQRIGMDLETNPIFLILP